MKRYLGIELGSTRIKAVAIDENYAPVSSGDYSWKSEYKNGIWTYNINEVWKGLKTALSGVENRESIKAAGVSGMMHGYLAFDKDWNLLAPFRTWQNTITQTAAEKLTETFNFNIPQRWSIAHLYQALLNKEDHINQIAHITTLAGYVHYMLTGVNAVGIGEASGIFPIDSNELDYNKGMIARFNELIEPLGLDWKLEELLPKVLVAGQSAGNLTDEGAKLIDNLLPTGIEFAPPEGDGDTGMVATNSVREKTGNVSAGTSIFSMVVLDKPLKKVYPQIDIITTPTGKHVAMVHCNNCTNDSNAWVSVLEETIRFFGADPAKNELYEKLYKLSLEGDSDCGGVLVCNYMAGEHLANIQSGRPMVVRKPDGKFTLANFFRATLYSTMTTLRMGMDILSGEDIKIESIIGHGGLFKTEGVGQKYLSAALNTPVTCMETAGEGGPYGMAVLAAFLSSGKDCLEDFLNNDVFKNAKSVTVNPEKEDIEGFSKYMEDYKKLLEVEQKASEVL